MKNAKHTALLALALLIAGCATTFHPSALSSIKAGMSREQAIQLLGAPDSSETINGAEQLHYLYSPDFNPSPASVPFAGDDDERVFKDLNNEKVFETEEYIVTLTDGQVSHIEHVE